MMKCRGMGKAMKPVALKKGGSVKDACYHKVKASYKVFPWNKLAGREVTSIQCSSQ